MLLQANVVMARPLPKLSTFLRPPPLVVPLKQEASGANDEGRSNSSSGFASPYSSGAPTRLPSFDAVSSAAATTTRPHYAVASAAATSAAGKPSNSTMASSTAGSAPIRVRERTSRYLSEGDRRDIISRINAGEKQVTLAKEYCVSRAAICNLYKNRKEVLTRTGRDLDAKHPKRLQTDGKTGAAISSTSRTGAVVQSEDSDASSIVSYSPARSSGDYSSFKAQGPQYKTDSKKDFRVHQVELPSSQPLVKPSLPSYSSHAAPSPTATPSGTTATRSDAQLARYSRFRVHEASASSLAIRRLVGELRDAQCVGSAFQRRASRLMRLLMEEALTQLPSHEVEVRTSSGDICRVARAIDERDICGVSMEESGMALMLRAFSEVQSSSPTGVISLGGSPTSADAATQASSSIRAQLPPLHPRNIVLLLDVECATGEEACAALRHLVTTRGVSPATIYFVSVVSSSPGLQRVHDMFPGAWSARLLRCSWHQLPTTSDTLTKLLLPCRRGARDGADGRDAGRLAPHPARAARLQPSVLEPPAAA